eukprot:9857570-Lingulodinium_polyedra.AAC.1
MQRAETTAAAEISTVRLDMDNMQEALKEHDARLEGMSQTLPEAHERCHQAVGAVSADLVAIRARVDSLHSGI